MIENEKTSHWVAVVLMLLAVGIIFLATVVKNNT